MNDTSPTLETFFHFERARASGGGDLKALESAKSMTLVKEALQNTAGQHSWSATAGELQSQIGELLDVSMLDIFVRAWNENKLFEKFLDPEKYDPKESILVSLKKHTMTSRHSPHIDVTLNGKAIGRIDFQIDLALTLEGIILKIQGGRIREVRLGNVKGHGTLKCEDLVLLKRETGTIEMPGVIHLPAAVSVRH